MEGVKKSLEIKIENAEFAKEFHYFIQLTMDGEGDNTRRTDLSACVTNPIFSANTFYMQLAAHKLEGNPRLHFVAYIVTDKKQDTQD